MSERTNAGYTIVDSLHIGGAEFVLGESKGTYGTKYVTWQCKDGNNYFWGHYFNDKFSAQKNLVERAQREIDFKEPNRPPKQRTDREER